MTDKKVTVTVQDLRKMVREAVALQLDKNKKDSSAEVRKKKEEDKEKAMKEGTQKITMESLRAMIKEAIALKLKEHEYGTEFHPGDDESLGLPEPEKSPADRDKAYNMAMGTDPSQPGWESKAQEDLEHAIKMLGRLGVSKSGRAALSDRIRELETMLSVSAKDSHFSRGEVGEAAPAYAPSDRQAPERKPVGLMAHDPSQKKTPQVRNPEPGSPNSKKQ